MASQRECKAVATPRNFMVWGAVMAFWLAGAVGLAGAAEVDPKKDTAHEVVEEATEVMFKLVREHKGGRDDRQAYFDAIKDVLEPVVDFSFIARNVMGSHREDASDDQIEAFTEVFKRGLVETYARGIANYTDSEITIQSPKEEDKDSRRVSVNQDVRHDGSRYRLSYTMAQNRAGEWKLINLVLDGVNLGQSFRSQFNQAMRQHSNDIDKVISNWLDEVEEAEA